MTPRNAAATPETGKQWRTGERIGAGVSHRGRRPSSEASDAQSDPPRGQQRDKGQVETGNENENGERRGGTGSAAEKMARSLRKKRSNHP